MNHDDGTINYSNYAQKDLKSCLASIDLENNPKNFAAVVAEIENRKQSGRWDWFMARKPKTPKGKDFVGRYLTWMKGEEKKSLISIIAMSAITQILPRTTACVSKPNFNSIERGLFLYHDKQPLEGSHVKF